ncbi:MAG TPA: CHAD domain-containing protein [Vicinamibacterales bacterium]|nr:CHAD domain-containing protein [Vicinamibacterales bacterium]
MAHATTRLRAGLDTSVATHAGTLEHELARARHGDVRGIHRARTTSRRLREALPVAAVAVPGASTDRARRDIRRLTRWLGKVRELDVALAELTAAATRHGWNAAAVGAIERTLAAERARRFADFVLKLDDLDAGRLRTRLDAIAAGLSADPLPRLAERALARRLRHRAVRLVAAIDAAGTVYIPERLHAVRIAAKKLRYTLELARDAAGLPVGRQIGALRRTQDVLGHLHDLQVLEGLVNASAAGPAGRVVAKYASAITQTLERACREQHALFLGRRAALASLARRTDEQVVRSLLGHRPRVMKLDAAALPRHDASGHRRHGLRSGRR